MTATVQQEVSHITSNLNKVGKFVRGFKSEQDNPNASCSNEWAAYHVIWLVKKPLWHYLGPPKGPYWPQKVVWGPGGPRTVSKGPIWPKLIFQLGWNRGYHTL